MAENRILGIDPGEKNIGLAISDPTGTIANPLMVIEHTSRDADARRIVRIAGEQGAAKIIVGQAQDWNGGISYQGRKAARLAHAIEDRTDLPVELWNEYGSTQRAREARRRMGVPRKKRGGHLDQIAATVILQSYLDNQE